MKIVQKNALIMVCMLLYNTAPLNAWNRKDFSSIPGSKQFTRLREYVNKHAPSYPESILNRMPKRISVFAQKNPYTTALLSALLTSTTVYGGYKGFRWAYHGKNKSEGKIKHEQPQPVLLAEPQAPVGPNLVVIPPILDQAVEKAKANFDQGKKTILQEAKNLTAYILQVKRNIATQEAINVIDALKKKFDTAKNKAIEAIDQFDGKNFDTQQALDQQQSAVDKQITAFYQLRDTVNQALEKYDS